MKSHNESSGLCYANWMWLTSNNNYANNYIDSNASHTSKPFSNTGNDCMLLKLSKE